jgi:cell division protein FtsB
MCQPSSEQILELQHELERARLEIDYLKQQNADLREMVKLLKQENK